MKSSQSYILLCDYFFQMLHIPIFFCDRELRIQYHTEKFHTIQAAYFKKWQKDVQWQKKLTFLLHENEGCVVIPYEDDQIACVIFGPVLFLCKDAVYSVKGTSFHDTFLTNKPFSLPYMNAQVTAALQLLYLQLKQEEFSREDLAAIAVRLKRTNHLQMMDEQLVQRREYASFESYPLEQKYCHYLKKGDINEAIVKVSQLWNESLSLTMHHDAKAYQFLYVSILTVTSRCAIEQGVLAPHALSLQEVCLHNMYETSDLPSLYHLLIQSVNSFYQLMQSSSMQHYAPLIRLCMAYIEEHLHERISVSQLSEALYVSPSYISIRFKEALQMTLIDYINQRKVEEACLILETTAMTITDITELLAFSNANYFARLFKKHKGILPSGYRHQKQTMRAIKA